jgi:hypothetical protein
MNLKDELGTNFQSNSSFIDRILRISIYLIQLLFKKVKYLVAIAYFS